ncbi:MAG: phosphate ABC transporter substrate-binding protein PstS [Polyangiaceae bacterium]|nr:phosphate ABC transporter substrate-binding protein PstS [Polyangiaceae bacterium]
MWRSLMSYLARYARFNQNIRFALILITMFVFAACASGGDGGQSTSLTGAGATFPYPLYTKWIAEYAKLSPGIAINYQSIGSGGGIRQLTERTVDFGASDAPMSDEQIEKAQGVIHIPTCIGAVVLAYNVEGVSTGLNLSADAIAGIYLGEIKQWDDPKIKTLNPDLALPAKPISSVHRSDGSGTTKIFLDYLSAVSPAWAKGPGSGTSVSWPGGLGAKGNEGVAAQVKSQPNTIGYIELAYAVQNRMSVAKLQNKAGKMVEPTLQSTTDSARAFAGKIPDDLRVSIVNADGETAYPIAGFTYILLRTRQDNEAKGKALVAFLRYALTQGQSHAGELHYASLPAEVIEKAQKRLDLVTGPSGVKLQ